MASLTDIDFAKFDLDEPLGALTTNGQQGTLRRFLAQGSTLREIAKNFRSASKMCSARQTAWRPPWARSWRRSGGTAS
jgi:hypothetical protein